MAEITTAHFAGLELASVRKSFQGVVALRGVNLRVPFGQIHGLIGENGAGKSTLVKVLAGKVMADTGTLSIDGRPVAITGTARGRRTGIATAYQELSLIPEWDVATNLLYGVEPSVRAGRVAQRALRAKAQEILDTYDATMIRPTALVRQLSLADRQVVEILRAVNAGQPVLLLDEPTSALAAERVEWFYDLIKAFVTPERLVMFISHRLEEVRDLCGYVTVLRDGTDVGQGPIEEMDEDRLVALMLGEQPGRLKAIGTDRPSTRSSPILSASLTGLPRRPGSNPLRLISGLVRLWVSPD